ncbi:hypothetical protein D9M72_303730 [compost metagenome]
MLRKRIVVYRDKRRGCRCLYRRHLGRRGDLRHVSRIFGITAALQCLGEVLRRLGVHGIGILALNQAHVVINKLIRRFVSAVLVPAAVHVVRGRDTSASEVLDVSEIVGSGDDTLTPAGFKAPLTKHDAWINAKSLPRLLGSRAITRAEVVWRRGLLERVEVNRYKLGHYSFTSKYFPFCWT